MLEIKPTEATTQDSIEIRAAETLLGCPQYAYKELNKEALTDHRVELPFSIISGVVERLATAKNVNYDNSYSKRGILSIFFNLERKWERIDKQIFSGKSLVDLTTETFLDTCIDLAAYSMKMCAWICTRRPDLYLKLLRVTHQECLSVGTIKVDE